MNSSSRSTKVLAPLAVLLAAGALAVGSGASFTSTTGNTVSTVTSGTLTQSNSKADQAIFTLSGMKPGDTQEGEVTITNTGSLPAAFSVTETSSTNGFSAGMLELTISDGTSTIYSGNFGDLAAEDLGVFGAGEARTYTFTVTLDATATDAEQGKAASAAYSWDAVQVDGETAQP